MTDRNDVILNRNEYNHMSLNPEDTSPDIWLNLKK